MSHVTSQITAVRTEKAAKPLGHYEQAIVHNGIVYVSGQLPIIPERPDHVIEGIENQTKQALENLKAVIEASGSDMTKVLKVTIFIADISLWAAANQVYSGYFGSHKPARSAVPTKALPKNYLIEIEAIAAQ